LRPARAQSLGSYCSILRKLANAPDPVGDAHWASRPSAKDVNPDTQPVGDAHWASRPSAKDINPDTQPVGDAHWASR